MRNFGMYTERQKQVARTVCGWQRGDEELLANYPESVPAGLPHSYVDVFIMSDGANAGADGLRPVQTGEVGEICFGGGEAGFIARGYWRQPELTDESSCRQRAMAGST